ncbi:MAG: DUF616 domain-containing protein [Lachnospiraceae bacterium]|nr:DUF616 domain-containing protein [Lachnospiraceae bacterium]
MEKNKEKIIIFGMGKQGQALILKMKQKNTIYCDEIVACCDNNPDLWGKEQHGISIVLPEQLIDMQYDLIVICSNYSREISDRLITMGIKKSRIYTSAEYERHCFTRDQYYKRRRVGNHRKAIKKDKVVVYTAITGEYDILNEPEQICSNVRYICFTDNRNVKSKSWEIRYVNNNLDNRLLAKHIKLFPEEYFDDCETSIWVDGKFQVLRDLRDVIDLYSGESPVLCFPHFERACIYDEAATCIYHGIGVKEDILRQISHYYLEGYPIDNGLYEMGCFIRRYGDGRLRALMDSWWQEIIKYSYRDQISFPYVCRKHDLLPDICNEDLYNNKWLLCKRSYSKKE